MRLKFELDIEANEAAHAGLRPEHIAPFIIGSVMHYITDGKLNSSGLVTSAGMERVDNVDLAINGAAPTLVDLHEMYSAAYMVAIDHMESDPRALIAAVLSEMSTKAMEIYRRRVPA